MKIFRTLIFCVCLGITLPAQAGHPSFFKTTRKNNILIIEVHNKRAQVYTMGSFYTKVVTGPAIISIDTLYQEQNEIYRNRNFLLDLSGKISFRSLKKNKEITIVPYDHLPAWQTLNYAYFLKKHFILSDTLHKRFSHYYYPLTNSYFTWEKTDTKNLEHSLFRQITDTRISFLFDSIATIQQQLVSCSDFIFQNAGKSDYVTLIDSLRKLPIEYASYSSYFSTAVLALTKSNPEYFFRIVNDFPADKRPIIYASVQYNRDIVKKLKLVQGNDDAKKAFLQSYRSDKLMAYKIAGMYLILGGLITLLISR